MRYKRFNGNVWHLRDFSKMLMVAITVLYYITRTLQDSEYHNKKDMYVDKEYRILCLLYQMSF